MSEPTWKKIALDLANGGPEGGREMPRHLEPVRQRIGATGIEGIANELVREMAWALGRAEEKVTTAIDALNEIGREIDALSARGDEASRSKAAARVVAFNKQREAAKQALWELRVHREAVGFRLNDDLHERYPIPAKR